MPNDPVVFFGSSEQQALLQRGAALHEITCNLPEYTYYGRTVGLVSPEVAPIETLVALTRLQGNSNFASVSRDKIAPLQSSLSGHGLVPVIYARWRGRAKALEKARALAARFAPPKAYKRIQLDAKTPYERRLSLADMALGCGVLPPSLSPLMGETRPGVCEMLLDADGAVVACAAAAAFLNETHPDHLKTCWWGMLAVDPAHRGKGLSLWLGALAILEMHNRFGFNDFFTGVEQGNRPSEAICAKLGFLEDDQSILGVADPSLVPGGRMTK